MLERPRFNANGLKRVLMRMYWEWDILIKPDMREHWARFMRTPIPLGHAYFNLFSEICRIPGGSYFVGHIFATLFFTQCVTIGLLIWRW